MVLSLSSAEGKKFILKDVIRGDFEYQKSLQQPLSSSPNLRVLIDSIPEDQIFVYDFLAGDPRFSQRQLSHETRRGILRSALSGLVELHDKGIIHTGTFSHSCHGSGFEYSDAFVRHQAQQHPHRLPRWHEAPGHDLAITQVRISDLEDAVLLEPGECINGCLCGHEFWRSPESWARAKQGLPSDVYSFAMVAIYVMLDHMVFQLSDAELGGDMAWWHILRKHVSHFGHVDGIQGLLEHLGPENPFFERVIALVQDFTDERPRQPEPFALWHYVDADFRELMGKMTNLDPKRRITAREALQHPWFQATELKK